MDITAVARAAGLTVLLDGKIGREEYRSVSGSLPALKRFADLVLRTAQEETAQVRVANRAAPVRAVSRKLGTARPARDAKDAALPRSDTDGDVGAAVVTVVERLSSTTVLVSWRDPTSCHYAEQTWRSGVARRQGLCALSGYPIQRGDSIYRPRSSGAEPPVNADAMILDVAIRDTVI
jgi:hypothetical protein